MKINEVINEGILGSIGKGLVDIVAPGAVKNFQSARSSQTIDQSSGTVNYQGKKYQWMGQQWGQLNPTTGKLIVAPKAIQTQLNILSTRKPLPKQFTQQAPAPQQQPTADKMPAPTTPAASAQQAVADKMQSAPAQQATTAQKISAPANPGAPTSAEQAKLQQKIQAAMAAQQQP